MTELELHRSVAEFLDWILMPPALWTTIPAGWTAMNKGAAGRLKACGLKAGLPDLMVFYNGLAIGIELKTDKGIVSAIQREMFNKLQAAGVTVSICRSVDDVEETLRTYSIPMRKFSHAPQKSLTSPEGRRPKESAQGARGAAP